MFLDQFVDVLRHGNSKWRAAWVCAIVLPILRPFARGLNELRGEIPDLRKPLLNLQAAGEAYVDVRLNDRKLGRGQTVLQLNFVLEFVDVDPDFAFWLKGASKDLDGAGDIGRCVA